MNCPICGGNNPEGYVVCSFCGGNLAGKSFDFQQKNYQQPIYSQQFQQSAYAQPTYPQYMMPGINTRLEEPVSIGEWLVSMLICCIPIAGFVMMLVWAFSGDTKKSKSNYFKASLIWSGIILGVYLVFFMIAMSVML